MEPKTETKGTGGVALERLVRPLCKPRKPHSCRLCGERINVGEPCIRWTGVEPGEGWWTAYTHPECYAQTELEDWDIDDWEACGEGDMDRPNAPAQPRRNPEPQLKQTKPGVG